MNLNINIESGWHDDAKNKFLFFSISGPEQNCDDLEAIIKAYLTCHSKEIINREYLNERTLNKGEKK